MGARASGGLNPALVIAISKGVRPLLTITVALAAVFGAQQARAQACVSVSDGLGNTTVHCPDGRIGSFRTDPAGAAAGMFGGQAFAGSASAIAQPPGPPEGAPSVAYVAPPLPSPPPIAPPPDPSPATPVPPLTPQPELTPLQRQYLQDRLLRKGTQPPARRAAEAGAPPKPTAR